MDTQPQEQLDQKNLQDEDVGQLKAWLNYLANEYRYYGFRKQRLEELMRRKKAKSWSVEKKSTMVRRLMTANKAMQEIETAMDQLRDRLSQRGIEVEVKSRSAA